MMPEPPASSVEGLPSTALLGVLFSLLFDPSKSSWSHNIYSYATFLVYKNSNNAIVTFWYQLVFWNGIDVDGKILKLFWICDNLNCEPLTIDC
jgi:hypothetical protein